MTFDQYSWTAQSAYRNQIHQSFEPVQPYVFFQYAAAAACNIFFDIGANVGVYTILTKTCKTVTEIYAFEPDETAFCHLVQNISSNKMTEVATAFDLVVSDQSGMVNFGTQAPASGINAVISTSIHGMEQYPSTSTRLSISIDEFYHGKKQTIAFKIDVEGHEKQVLEGAQRVLVENAAIIQCEIYQNHEETTKFMADLGYRKIFAIKNDYYFSNIAHLVGEQVNLDIISKALSKFVDDSVTALYRYGIQSPTGNVSGTPTL